MLSGILEKEGFEVERGVAGHETAFLARKNPINRGRPLHSLQNMMPFPDWAMDAATIL